MDSDMATYLIIGLIIGIIIGVIFTNAMSSKARKYKQAQQELDKAKQELAAQKQLIVKHFSHSAEILDNMAKEFRRLYQHMAENSSSLLTQEEINDTLKNTPKITLDTNAFNTGALNADKVKNDEPALETAPPKDYSGNPSGLLKNNEESKI
ncbi:DUF1043 family protein [Orbaceae bacterium ac157xtp]